MSALFGAFLVVLSATALALAPDPESRVAMAFSIIAVASLRRGTVNKTTLGFCLVYLLGLAVFARLQAPDGAPHGWPGALAALRTAVADAQALMSFLAPASVVLGVNVENLLNSLLRIPVLRPTVFFISTAAAQLRYLEYLLPSISRAQWGRGALRTATPLGRAAGLVSVTVTLAVNYLLDAERRGDLAETGPRAGLAAAAPAPAYLPGDLPWSMAYLIAGLGAFWLSRYG